MHLLTCAACTAATRLFWLAVCALAACSVCKKMMKRWLGAQLVWCACGTLAIIVLHMCMAFLVDHDLVSVQETQGFEMRFTLVRHSSKHFFLLDIDCCPQLCKLCRDGARGLVTKLDAFCVNKGGDSVCVCVCVLQLASHTCTRISPAVISCFIFKSNSLSCCTCALSNSCCWSATF